MSLRWRLALALALLAGLATITTASFAYVSTRDRLTPRTTVPGRAVGQLPQGSRTAQRGTGRSEPPARTGPSAARAPGAPRPRRPDGAGRATRPPQRRPRARLTGSDPASQLIDRTGGTVLPRHGGRSTLPVDDGDRAIAASGSGHRYRTVSVDGVPYRVLHGGGGRAARCRWPGTSARRAGCSTRCAGASPWSAWAWWAPRSRAGWLIARRTTRPLEELTDGGRARGRHRRAEPRRPRRLRGRRPAGRDRAAGPQLHDDAGGAGPLPPQQQQLVQDASHELRTPLTSLRTNIEVLARHRDLPADQRDALDGGPPQRAGRAHRARRRAGAGGLRPARRRAGPAGGARRAGRRWWPSGPAPPRRRDPASRGRRRRWWRRRARWSGS